MYNEGVLQRAMWKSLSLWRTHGGPSKREKYEGWRRGSPSTSIEEPVIEEDEDQLDQWHPASESLSSPDG